MFSQTIDAMFIMNRRICLGEEDAAELAEGEKPRLAQDRWIHACRCSLISHESVSSFTNEPMLY